MKKGNLKEYLLVFALGIILTSSIGVFAYTYSSKSVKFTSNDASWKVSDVESAINDLYEMNKFSETIDNAECVSGTYVCGDNCSNSTGQVIMSDFAPSKVVIWRLDNAVAQVFYYDKKESETYYKTNNGSRQTTLGTMSDYWWIRNNSLIAHNHATNWKNSTVYYVACK